MARLAMHRPVYAALRQLRQAGADLRSEIGFPAPPISCVGADCHGADEIAVRKGRHGALRLATPVLRLETAPGAGDDSVFGHDPLRF